MLAPDLACQHGGAAAFCWLLQRREGLAFPASVAKSIWAMIQASDDPEAKAFVFATTRMVETAHRGDEQTARAVFRRYVFDWLTPPLLHAALDELATRQELAPRLAARLHQRIDRYSHEGVWTYSAEEAR